MPPIIPRNRNVLFGSNKVFGRNIIPHKTEILKAFLKEPPKLGETKRYPISKNTTAFLKKQTTSNEISNYYKLTILKEGKQKQFFVKEATNIKLAKEIKITGYNEFLANTHPSLRKELENQGFKVINTFYGFSDKKTGRNFVVTEYMDPSKYETIDNLYTNKQLSKKEYLRYKKEIEVVFTRLKKKGYNVADIDTHNIFLNKKNQKEMVIFDIMLDLGKT